MRLDVSFTCEIVAIKPVSVSRAVVDGLDVDVTAVVVNTDELDAAAEVETPAVVVGPVAVAVDTPADSVGPAAVVVGTAAVVVGPARVVVGTPAVVVGPATVVVGTP